MGILDKFKNPFDDTVKNGSTYGPKYTANNSLPEFKLAGRESPLHANPDGTEGYSLNGAGLSEVQKLYNEYDDGVPNSLPPLDKLTLDNPQATCYTDLQTGKPVSVLYTSKSPYTNPETKSE
jgi:hypothetical protein